MLERGDPVHTVAPLVDEAEGYTSPYDTLSVSFVSACRAILAIRAGDRDRAVAQATEAIKVIDGTQQVWQQADARRYLSEVPRVTGDVDLERRWLLEADQMYRRKEIHSYDVEIHRRLAELDESSGGIRP
jgi:ATP/maltotriose-dependent transcriptional regulator MalT